MIYLLTFLTVFCWFVVVTEGFFFSQTYLLWLWILCNLERIFLHLDDNFQGILLLSGVALYPE